MQCQAATVPLIPPAVKAPARWLLLLRRSCDISNLVMKQVKICMDFDQFTTPHEPFNDSPTALILNAGDRIPKIKAGPSQDVGAAMQ